MKRHPLGLALGSLVSLVLVLVGGARTALGQDVCAPTVVYVQAPAAGHSFGGRIHDLLHTPAPVYRPTHYTDWFWNAAGHAMTDKHLIKCLHPEDACGEAPAPPPLTGPPQGPIVGPDRPVPGFLRGHTPPNSGPVSKAYHREAFSRPAFMGPTRPNR